MSEIKKLDETLNQQIEKEIHEMQQEVVQNRRYLHMHPEIGFDTGNTEKMVRQQLTAAGIEILPGKMGVFGKIAGRDSSRLIALRADMDALCLQEENDVPYKSVYPNKMHACGHDGHTAMLLAASKVLQKHRDQLPTDVLLIFQPAEEGPNLGGARVMLADLEEKGMADRIWYSFGMHLFNDFESGKVGYRCGSLMSSTDEFDIKIIGRGGHAGQPDKTIDAVSVGTKFVSAMESYMSRRIDPFEPAVFSIGIFYSGSAKNIVAETARIAGTIRCQSEDVRTQILKNLETVLKGVCLAYGAEYHLETLRGLPILMNHPQATAYAAQVAKAAVGEDNTFEIQRPVMGAEDFAFFAQRIPSSFLWLGSRSETKGLTALAHHPKFDFDEDAMKTGIKVLCSLALCAEDENL